MDMQMRIKSLGLELSGIAINLMMDKRCSVDTLHKIVIALRCNETYPRWETFIGEFSEEFRYRVMYGDWDEKEELPDYCFSCGRIESSERGHLRESCSDCRNSNPSLRSNLFNMQALTGYPENLFEYLILKEVKQRKTKWLP